MPSKNVYFILFFQKPTTTTFQMEKTISLTIKIFYVVMIYIKTKIHYKYKL